MIERTRFHPIDHQTHLYYKEFTVNHVNRGGIEAGREGGREGGEKSPRRSITAENALID